MNTTLLYSAVAALSVLVLVLLIVIADREGSIAGLEGKPDIAMPVACQYPDKLEPLIMAKMVQIKNEMNLADTPTTMRSYFDMKCEEY